MDVGLLPILGVIGVLAALIVRARLSRGRRTAAEIAKARRLEALRRVRGGSDAGGTAGDMGG
ncbi:MAG: hypothetical protein AAF763_17720, partial [Pseudomonadota bacterium]